MLNVPTWSLGNERNHAHDQDWNKHLEDDNKFPIPLSELLDVLASGVCNPEADEGTDGVEELPEGHDETTNLGWCHFTNVDWSSSESNTLTETNDHTTTDEDTEIVARSEGLHESGDDGEECTDEHSNSSTESISLLMQC